MENNINDHENSKNDADRVLKNCKVLKANSETNIASWPMFIPCSSLLTQNFSSVDFGDPVKSILPPPLFRTL